VAWPSLGASGLSLELSGIRHDLHCYILTFVLLLMTFHPNDGRDVSIVVNVMWDMR